MTEDHINKTAQTANNAIAALAEAAKIEQRVDGQGVRYWAEVAAHSMAHNDTLISQLKEKEKIAAEQEQRITSLQNEILNQVYAGTQEDLKAACEKAHEDAAEWERKFNDEAASSKVIQDSLTTRIYELTQEVVSMAHWREVAEDARKGQEAVQAELDALREKTRALIRYAEINECTHDETHRGGSLWTICDRCGRKWADDQGGFKPYEEPEEIKAARQAIGA